MLISKEISRVSFELFKIFGTKHLVTLIQLPSYSCSVIICWFTGYL